MCSAEEIVPIIHSLTQDFPTQQKETLDRYFTPNANFLHPFCATGSWRFKLFGQEWNSRWATLQIYQWYKILSPRIDLEVLSVAFDKETLYLYVTVQQHFRLWMVPYYDADVRFTTVLRLVEGDASGPASAISSSRPIKSKGRSPYSYAAVASSDSSEKSSNADGRNGIKYYYIMEQNDCYQVSEWIKFLIPWGIGNIIVWALWLWNTFLSILGAYVFFPQTWWKERSVLDIPEKI